MLVTIKYFGLIAEITKCQEESLQVSGVAINDLLNILYLKYPSLKEKDFQVAQNQELVSFETLLNGKEIALLPPFAGG